MSATGYRAKDFGASITRRFPRSVVRNFFAKTVSSDPVVFSHLVVPDPKGHWSVPPPPEAGFAIHVIMAPLPKLDIAMEGYGATLTNLGLGDIGLYDLAKAPATLFVDPLETLRIQISQRTLDDLAYDQQRPPIAGLRSTFGENDAVLYGLSLAFLKKVQLFQGHDGLFLDHVALAFHTHIAQTYGQHAAPGPLRGGLTPWQFQRARDLLMSKLSEGVALKELAEACGLSAGYFARAFRRSAGMPAHKWLMNERIKRAKDLLGDRELSLPEIGLACGFADQSHFTRVFSRLEGDTPARWRRLRFAHLSDSARAEAALPR